MYITLCTNTHTHTHTKHTLTSKLGRAYSFDYKVMNMRKPENLKLWVLATENKAEALVLPTI